MGNNYPGGQGIRTTVIALAQETHLNMLLKQKGICLFPVFILNLAMSRGRKRTMGPIRIQITTRQVTLSIMYPNRDLGGPIIPFQPKAGITRVTGTFHTQITSMRGLMRMVFLGVWWGMGVILHRIIRVVTQIKGVSNLIQGVGVTMGVLTMASHQELTTGVQGSLMEINIMGIEIFPYGIPSFQNMMGKFLGMLMKSS